MHETRRFDMLSKSVRRPEFDGPDLERSWLIHRKTERRGGNEQWLFRPGERPASNGWFWIRSWVLNLVWLEPGVKHGH